MFWFRRMIGVISRRWFPYYGYCGRCNRTWNICESHVTPVKIDRPVSSTIFPGESHDFLFDPGTSDDFHIGIGVFSLCESCWKELPPEQRLSYYRDFYFKWADASRSYSWTALREAVLSE